MTAIRVESLDHVNIITPDLDAAARFYAELLGLERRDPPPPLASRNAQWLYDDAGRAIIHLNSVDCPRAYNRDVRPGPTGALHHVALRCSGYEELLARLSRLGLDYQLNDLPAVRLRQVFTQDPNGVLLELNFFAQ